MNPGAARVSSEVRAPPILVTTGDVAALVGLPLQKLTWWVYALRLERRYDRFSIVRRSGGADRIISAPIKPIKDIQRRLARVLTDCYDPPVNVHGFVPGRSPRSNASRHRRQTWVLKFDLDEFFPSINFGRVRGMFMAFPFDYPAPVATLLAHICCYENELPQGAPTSPIVSNFICRGLDVELGRLARAERCFYTRYADDVCLSTDRSSFPTGLASYEPSAPATLGKQLTSIIVANGFSINPEKTRLMRRTQRQRVTGLLVNEKLNVPSEYVRNLRNLLHIWERYGQADAAAAFERAGGRKNWPPDKPAPAFNLIVRGRVQYVGSIKGWSSSGYRQLASTLQRVDPSFKPRTLLTLEAPQVARLFTEGKSDYLHLLAAQRYFHAQGDFVNLRLTASSESDAGGDARLMEKCRGLALTPQHTPCIGVFDTDNDDLLRSAVGGAGFKNYGNRVAAIAIALPDWRDAPRACIEMLYRDADLQRRDDSGRRLYLAEEFDRRTGRHHTERVHTPHPGGRTLVREEVLELETGASVGLAKVAFGKHLRDRAGVFADVSFDGFRPTFERLQEAVARIASG